MLDKSRIEAPRRYSYAVDPAAQFEAGQIAKLTQGDDGQPMVQVCNSGELPQGTLWKDKATTLTAIVVDEAVKFDSLVKNLKQTNLVSATEKVTNQARTVTYVSGYDYDIDYAKGTITRRGGGTIILNQTVLVTYRYDILVKDLYRWGQSYNFIPDYTLASGKITVVEDFAILYSLVYDPTAVYLIGDALRVMDGGILTTDPYEVGPVFAKVIKPPTAGDPYLGYEQRTVMPGD
jgi:hypothetical protein